MASVVGLESARVGAVFFGSGDIVTTPNGILDKYGMMTDEICTENG